jgi:restriction system protein
MTTVTNLPRLGLAERLDEKRGGEMTGTWFCTDCKAEIPDEVPSCDRSQRKPCPSCDSFERSQYVFDTDSPSVPEGTMVSVSSTDLLNFNESAIPTIEVLESLPTLFTQALVIPESKTFEGDLIRAVTIPWRTILGRLLEDPSLMYQMDPRKWEEFIAGSYEESGLFDEVILTHRSGDGGKDVIAIKKGYGSIRLVESVKRYTPGHEVTADDVRALGCLLLDPKNSKGIISTTWRFAPKIDEDPLLKALMPYRLELVDGEKLIERFKLWEKLNQGRV